MSDDTITIHLTITGEQGAPRVPLVIPKSISATQVRQRASETTRIPLNTIKLIFRGRLISDDDSKLAVDEYKLEEGSVLHCMGKPVPNGSAGTDAAAATSTTPVVLPPNASTVSIPASAATSASTASSSISSDPLTAALQAMRAANSPADYQTAVQVLDKLLHNIMAHPLEEKYRRVKKQNPAFQRRLGGIAGGEAVLLAAGFVNEKDESNADVFMMQASAEAWPRLQATKAKVEQALRQVNAARAPSLPVGPPMGQMGIPPMMGGAGGMPAGFPSMGQGNMPFDQQAMARMMSDPVAVQNILQNPMIQNVMRNDPRIANDPMMQRMLGEMTSNPAMMQQMLQVMQNPQMMQQIQTMMQNPEAMQAMRQQMQGMMPPGQAMPSMMPPAGGFPNFMPNAAYRNTGNAGANGGNNGSQQQQNRGANDEDLTEEEMIAEAIRRSLADQHPPS